MLTFTKIQTNHKHYDFVEELLHQHFLLTSAEMMIANGLIQTTTRYSTAI